MRARSSSPGAAGRQDMGLQRLHTPRAAALAGVFFALLFSASLLLLRSAVPPDVSAETTWVEDGADQITAAVALMPFAGIAFLWFVGVVRDRMGRLEDRFFSSVFFGSSLLFLAMAFVQWRSSAASSPPSEQTVHRRTRARSCASARL